MRKGVQAQKRQKKLDCKVYLESALKRQREDIDDEIISDHKDRSLAFYPDKTSTTIIKDADPEYNCQNTDCTIGK